jgi:hypothetical protein
MVPREKSSLCCSRRQTFELHFNEKDLSFIFIGTFFNLGIYIMGQQHFYEPGVWHFGSAPLA